MTGSRKGDPNRIRQWERGWNEHEQMQLKRLAGLPFGEKLTWLEEAHRVVRQMYSRQSESGNDDHSSR